VFVINVFYKTFFNIIYLFNKKHVFYFPILVVKVIYIYEEIFLLIPSVFSRANEQTQPSYLSSFLMARATAPTGRRINTEARA